MSFFKSNFKFLRKQAGQTQADIASELNRVPQTIGGWENEVSEPNLDDLINISIKYGISIDDLLTIDLTKGKVNEGEKNSPKGKVSGKVSGKVTNETVDSTGVEVMKIALSAKNEVIATKDQVIAAKESQIDSLNITVSTLKDEIEVLKREISGLEKQIGGHTGGSAQSGQRRSA